MLGGPFIHIRIEANELNEGHVIVKLPDGYTYEQLYLNELSNITELYPYQRVYGGARLIFPPVNCKSPSNLYLFIPDITKAADARISI